MAERQGTKAQSETVYPESEVVPLKPVESEPQTVGDLLRGKRKEFGVDLREAADYLRIRLVYLEAIEEGRVDDLPGATYAMGFVRAYADYLGLDGPAIVERYKAETTELGDDVRLIFPLPVTEGKIPSAAILLVAVIGLAVTYGGWAFLAQKDVSVAELVPSLPERFSAFLGSEETEAPAVLSEAEQDPPREDAVSASTPEPSSPQETVAVEAPKADEPQAETSGTPVVENATVTNVTETPPEKTPTEQTSETAATVQQERPAALEQVTETSTPVPSTSTEPAPSTLTEEVAAAPVQETPSPEVTPLNSPETSAPLETSVQQPKAPETPAVESTQPVISAVTAPEAEPATQPAETEVTVPTQTSESVVASSTFASSQTQNESQEQSSSIPDTSSNSVVAALPPKPPAEVSAEPRQYGVENADARVVVTARVDSWVEIRGPEGNLFLTRVLRAGDSYRVPGQPGLLMLTGNAGGLEIQVDGEVIPDLGPSGAVRRDVPLDAESLKAGAGRR